MRSRFVGCCMAWMMMCGAAWAQSAGPALPPMPADLSPLAQEVWKTETAFAASMANRDHAAFVAHLSEEAIFAGGTVQRGRARVAEAWKAYFDGPRAPFSWGPAVAVVLDSGNLAMTSGPVFDPAGKRTGTFISTWRKDPDGRWRIIFDTGCPPCKCE